MEKKEPKHPLRRLAASERSGPGKTLIGTLLDLVDQRCLDAVFRRRKFRVEITDVLQLLPMANLLEKAIPSQIRWELH